MITVTALQITRFGDHNTLADRRWRCHAASNAALL